MKSYHVEPFYPATGSKNADVEVAKQMSAVINRFASEGWGYEGYEEVTTLVNQGCLALFQHKEETRHMLVFSIEAI